MRGLDTKLILQIAVESSQLKTFFLCRNGNNETVRSIHCRVETYILVIDIYITYITEIMTHYSNDRTATRLAEQAVSLSRITSTDTCNLRSTIAFLIILTRSNGDGQHCQQKQCQQAESMFNYILIHKIIIY